MTKVIIPLPDTSLASPGSYASVEYDDGKIVLYTDEVGGPPGGDTEVVYDSNVTKTVVVNTINALVQLLTRMPA